MRQSLFWAAIATGAILMIAAMAFAQTSSGSPPGTPPMPQADGRFAGPPGMPGLMSGPMMLRMMPGMMPGPGPIAALCSDRDAALAGIFAFARTKLAIGDGQAAAWDKFTTAVHGAIEPLVQFCPAPPQPNEPPPSLPQRLARMETFETARLDTLKRLRAALDELYPQLSDEQRQIADRLPPHL